MVEVHGNEIRHIWGNPHVLGGLQLCPRGVAGKALLYDSERPKFPMIRDGERGAGKWKRASWDEALTFITDKLKKIIDKHGPRSIVLSDRGGPITDFQKTFIAAMGSPNYFNHHASCSNSVHNGHMSFAGLARNSVGFDYKNCQYLIAYGRNIFESLGTAEAKNVIDMIQSGGKLVFFDVRWNYTANKAHKFFIIKPGSDYAINLSLINVILKEKLYDGEFVQRWVTGLRELESFITPYKPQWGEKETGIPAKDIISIAHEVSEAKPAVIFHPGWMTAWYSSDFYLRRSIYILNALMGSYEAEGGLFIGKAPNDANKPFRTLLSQVPKVKGERFDGAGTKYPHLGAQWGLAQKLPEAIETENPYPIKAYIVMRHDPLASLPEPDTFKKVFNKLDLIVSIDVNYSETAWSSDVILPESTYLERTDHVFAIRGLKPALALRKQAVTPKYDTKPRSYIFQALAQRLGAGKYFPYETIEDLIKWQLEGTGFTIDDFNDTGIIRFTDNPIWFNRKNGLKFNTLSKKLEIISETLQTNGIDSLTPYKSPKTLQDRAEFRLVTGKNAIHTQGRTTANNPLLNEILSENHLWINGGVALELDIEDGNLVEVSSKDFKQAIKAKLTDYIHPEAVFMLHGFGDSVPLRTRSYQKGISDVKLQSGALTVSIGGNCPLTECVVTVKKSHAQQVEQEISYNIPRIPKWRGVNYIQQIQQRCIGCKACELHCKSAHNISKGPALGIIVKRPIRVIDSVPRVDFDFIHCFQCKNPRCITDCPTSAMKRREKDNTVYVDHELCNGCGECIEACPWRVPKLYKDKQKVFKCDYCIDRIDIGLEPACVAGCTTKALLWASSQNDSG